MARWKGGRGGGRELAEPGSAETVKCLSASHYQEFVKHVADRRDRLLSHVMVSTGLRISEVLGLDTSMLPDPTRPENKDKRYLPQSVTGKGRKVRTIEWPATLLAQVRRYCREERLDIVENLLERGRQADCNALWLSVRGNRLCAGHVERVFRDASRASRNKATPHMLRHTYATQLLGSLLKAEASGLEAIRARGGIPAAGDMVMNPLRFVQRRMGHAHITTTFIYLHLIEDADPATLLAQDNFIKGYVG